MLLQVLLKNNNEGLELPLRLRHVNPAGQLSEGRFCCTAWPACLTATGSFLGCRWLAAALLP